MKSIGSKQWVDVDVEHGEPTPLHIYRPAQNRFHCYSEWMINFFIKLIVLQSKGCHLY